ncbi:integrase [Vibrio vulnificus]|uniref:site-specific integrase n=2 Tax=Vibrio TaxID=662 RepID=UPI0005005EAD|nr:site-specific integrase [Vibrio vulnificus]KFK51786.1 integrase [Vibrio vulnificus]
MAYSIIHTERNGQRSHILIDNITTLPAMFVSIYGMNELGNKALGTQENILSSLRFFHEYYYKKHKTTFDFDFHTKTYNISHFIEELDGFFHYLLTKQHLIDEQDIQPIGLLPLAISKANKTSYGAHIRNVGKFFRYLNDRYMNLRYQDMSPADASNSHLSNESNLKHKIKTFDKTKVSQNEPAHSYKSLEAQQSIELTNMLLPSTPEFVDTKSGELFEAVINPQNPFSEGFQQYRNYLIHRLMFNYGLRVGEVLLLMTDCIGESLPDANGDVHYILVVQNLPDDVLDPRKNPPSIKTIHSYRQIELTADDYIMLTIYMEQYRAPLYEEKGLADHQILFIKGSGQLPPLTYDAVRSIYKTKIDPSFIALYPHYRNEKNRKINYMCKITPHVGRHTWAYITLEFIYNELLKENVMMAQDYGISARMNGVLEPAVERLRTLGGWSITSNIPLKYAKRFLEIVSNKSNKQRTYRNDWQKAIPSSPNTPTESTFNPLRDNDYDEDIPFDIFD